VTDPFFYTGDDNHIHGTIAAATGQTAGKELAWQQEPQPSTQTTPSAP
jgi:hypothetical protein